MTEVQKELLKRDLCARLPYGVNVEYTFKVTVIATNTEEIRTKPLFLYSINTLDNMTVSGIDDDRYETICFLEEVKPYLFPLSSMSEEQEFEFHSLQVENSKGGSYSTPNKCSIMIDWLNKNHFDYCGLIPMGLAIDATGLNIYLNYGFNIIYNISWCICSRILFRNNCER